MDYVGLFVNIRAIGYEEMRQQTWRLEYFFHLIEMRMHRPKGLPVYRIMM